MSLKLQRCGTDDRAGHRARLSLLKKVPLPMSLATVLQGRLHSFVGSVREAYADILGIATAFWLGTHLMEHLNLKLYFLLNDFLPNGRQSLS